MPGDSKVVDNLVGWIARQVDEEQGDTTEALQSIIAQVMAADDVDELLEGAGATHARDVLNLPLYVTHVTWVESDITEDGCPFYAVFHCTRPPSGTPDVVTCGGWRVVAEAARISQLQGWPQMISIVNARKNAKGGKMPLKLSRPI